ncbi:hypothetical protein D3C85_1646900 [compost metagenome]
MFTVTTDQTQPEYLILNIELQTEIMLKIEMHHLIEVIIQTEVFQTEITHLKEIVRLGLKIIPEQNQEGILMKTELILREGTLRTG